MTTSRQLYEATLIELNKENAPNLLLEDFNYFANKAIYQYTNKRYNVYDVSQQTTDDLRVLKATALLTPKKTYSKYQNSSDSEYTQVGDNPTLEDLGFMGATYEVILPSDYYHILNCICIYDVRKTFKCYNAGDVWRRPATRLTADLYSQILDNWYLRPTYRRPYYYIHNVNQNVSNPTNPYEEYGWEGSTDISSADTNFANNSTEVEGGLPKTITIGENKVTTVEKEAGIRYGNKSEVRLEIRYGSDDSLFKLKKVYIDYLKTPQHIRLTQAQLDKTEDTSQVLEFPDYVCQEIVNELVHLLMENFKEERLQTHPVVSQSIATQQQAPEQAGNPQQS